MILQHPLLLIGLLALIIPILVHLFNFRRFKKVYFSSIQFLKKIDFDTNKQSKLKKIIVLTCRCLALFFIVLAFVQPLIQTSKHSELIAQSKAVSLFVDNSFSMNAIGEEISLLEIAKHTARDIVKGYESNTKFQIITNDLMGKQQHLLTKEDALIEIDQIEISNSSRKLQEILQRQTASLNTMNPDKKIVYFISDFQKSQESVVNNPSIEFYCIPLKNEKKQNVYIDTCWFEEPIHLLNQTNHLLVRIKNSGENNYENVRLTCEINAQIKSITDFSILAKSTKIDTIVFKNNVKGWNNIKLAINDFPIIFDDNYYTTLEVIDKINVLHIYEDIPNKYVRSVYEKSEFFQYNATTINQLDYSKIRQNHLVVLDGIKSYSTGLQSEVDKFVTNNGNLLIVPNAEPDLTSYNQFFSLLQISTMGPNEKIPTQVSSINRHEKTFSDVFSQWNTQMDLPLVNNYFRINTSSNILNEPLITMKNNLPLVIKYSNSKKGNIFFINSALRADDGGLPFSSFFAPMLYKMAITGKNNQNNNILLGAKSNFIVNLNQNNSLNSIKRSEGSIKIKTETEEVIPAILPLGQELQITINESIKHAGFGVLIHAANEVITSLGFNFNRNESLLSYFTIEELKEKYPFENFHFITEARENIGQIVKELESGIPLWKYCVILCLTFLLLEIIVLRYWETFIKKVFS